MKPLLLWKSNKYCILVCVCMHHCCRGRTTGITCTECVSVAFVNQHSKSMRCIILLSVASPAVPYLWTLSHKQHNFRKKIIEHKMCFDFLCSIYLKHFSFWEKFREIVTYVKCLQVNYPLFSAYFN